jgi:hypothetical protein
MPAKIVSVRNIVIDRSMIFRGSRSRIYILKNAAYFYALRGWAVRAVGLGISLMPANARRVKYAPVT